MGAGDADLLDGDALARRIRTGLAEEVAGLRARAIVPAMTSILVGDDPASLAYLARKHADCRELGMASREIRLDAGTSPERLEREIDALNADPSVHGLLVQLPLPEGLDDLHFVSCVSPDKDIDGLHPQNLGRLVAGQAYVLPCTPAGILTLLRHHEVPLAGQRVLIIGRGMLVGRPLALLLSMKGIDATITLAHSATPALGKLAREADVIISAAGVPDLVTAEMVRPGAAVVGVGISYDSDGQMVSDIATDVAGVAGWVTPRHGSIGALTRAMLLKNLVRLAGRRLAVAQMQENR